MPITTNISQYACDRCQESSYYSQAQQASGWMTVKRYTVDRIETERVLCPACYEEYKALAAKHDQEFNDFMARKES